MKNFLAAICAAGLLMTGCNENPKAILSEVEKAAPVKSSITIQINGRNFAAKLEDNPSARVFAKMLPLEVEMTELNDNEKYFYTDKNLPSNATNVKQIHSGDLMLFGSNCVVLFYKDFSTNYSYTRLGKVDNPIDLEKSLGAGDVNVRFEE